MRRSKAWIYPGGAGCASGIATADDDQVFVDDAGGGECNRECAEVGFQAVDDQAFAEIDVAVFSKARNELAGFGVEAVEKVHHAGVDATVLRRHSNT